MKRAWIPLTLESGINVTPSPQSNFIGKINTKTFQQHPKINTIDVITNNIVTNNNRNLSHS